MAVLQGFRLVTLAATLCSEILRLIPASFPRYHIDLHFNAIPKHRLHCCPGWQYRDPFKKLFVGRIIPIKVLNISQVNRGLHHIIQRATRRLQNLLNLFQRK